MENLLKRLESNELQVIAERVTFLSSKDEKREED